MADACRILGSQTSCDDAAHGMPEQRDRLDSKRIDQAQSRSNIIVDTRGGLGGSSKSWESQYRNLSDTFRVVAWDCPGYGASDDLADPTPGVDDTSATGEQIGGSAIRARRGPDGMRPVPPRAAGRS